MLKDQFTKAGGLSGKIVRMPRYTGTASELFVFRDPLLAEIMVTVKERLDQMEEDEEDNAEGNTDEEYEDSEEDEEEEESDDGDDEDDSGEEENEVGGSEESNEEATDSGICISE